MFNWIDYTVVKKALIKCFLLCFAGLAYVILLTYSEASMHRFEFAHMENLWPVATFSMALYLYVFILYLPAIFVALYLFEFFQPNLLKKITSFFDHEKSQKNSEPRSLKGFIKKYFNVYTIIKVSLSFLVRRLWLSWFFILFYLYLVLSTHAEVAPDFYAKTVMFLIGLAYFFLGFKKIIPIVTSLVFGAFIVSGFVHYSYYWTSTGKIKGEHPNILLIVSDTTRRDHMTFFGYKRNTTPNMKKLADRGVVLNDAHSTSSWTKPATASLVTSQNLSNDPIHHGAPAIGYHGTHMAEFFREKGYDTALISANSNASSFYGTAKGYGYRTHSLAPEHSALQKFSVIKFYQRYFDAKTSLHLKNKDIALDNYLEYLKLKPGEISDFLSGKKQAGIKISDKEKRRFIKYINKQLSKKVASELFQMPSINAKQRTFMFEYLRFSYNYVMKLFYLTMENAAGQVVDYWIQDHKAVDLTTNWLQNIRRKEKPFFIHIQMMGPHTPYVTQLPDLLSYFDPHFENPIISPSTQHTPPSVPAPKMPKRKLENMMANYDDAIRNTDANLQNIVEFLRKSGELENTIIVFTADHGEAFFEHNIFGHMNSLHSELVDIPIFFYWKNKLPSMRIDRAASIIDIYPSLTVLAGFAEEWKSMSLEGYSLFQPDLTINNDIPADRTFPMATLVGSAWKMKRKSVLPFGIHTAVVTRQGKIIREMEEIGGRILFFAPKDRVEKREVLNPLTIESSPELQNLIQQLPNGPIFFNKH